MPEEDSRWRGDCYVFDERVAVGHGLKAGDYVTCRACGLPHLRDAAHDCAADGSRSEEHTSELQSLMRISYAVFCLKKKKQTSITDEASQQQKKQSSNQL